MIQALLLLARWIAVAHDRWRASAADGSPLKAKIAVLKERLERLRSENDILRERLARIDPRRRPHYRPWERLRILWHQARYHLSLAATARAFLVTVQTLVNWRRAVERGEGPEVDGRVPLRRISDAATELVLRIKRDWPRWGSRRIAGALVRLGLVSSRTTVRRIRRRPPPAPTRADDVRGLRGPLVAKRPGHLWLMDFTRVLRRRGIGHRYGAVGRKGSIALLERFWRTMKDEYACGLVLFRPLASIRARLTSYVGRFNRDRPHQGLAQHTPEEAHTGRSTRPAAVPLRAGLVAEYVAGDRDLPVLRLRRAA